MELKDRQRALAEAEEKTHAYYLVKGLVYGAVDLSRVAIRDVRSYCGVLLDDNNRKPICRFHFNAKQKSIALFDRDRQQGEREVIHRLDDIGQFRDRLQATIRLYERD